MSSYQQSSKYKLVVSEFGSSFQVAIEDTTQSGTAIQDDIDNFELHFLTALTGFTVSANKNHAFISDGGASSSSNFEWIHWNFYEAVDGSLTPTSFSTTTYQMVLATFTPPTPDITLDAFKAMIDINHTRIIDFPESVNYPTNYYSLQHDGGFGGDTGGGGMIVDNSSHITFTNFTSQNDWVYFDVVVESLPENNGVTWDYLSYITIYTGLQGFTAHNENAVENDYIKVINSPDNWYIGYGDGTSIHFRTDSTPSESQIGTSLGTIGMHHDYLITESGYFSGDGDTTFNTSDAHSFFTDWNGNTAYSNSLDLRGYSGSEYMEEYGFKWSASDSVSGDDTSPSEPVITYTHIGNAGGNSGIDDTETQYPNETTAVQFSETEGVLGVVTSSLYTDQGSDGSTPTEMGVYLDLGMGLASTLLPSQNTVTAPKAGQIIQDSSARYSLNISNLEPGVSINLVDSFSNSEPEEISSVSLSFSGTTFTRADFQLNAVSVSGLTVDYFKSDDTEAMGPDTIAYMTITKSGGGNLLDVISDGEGTHLMRIDSSALMDAFDVNASSYNTNDGEVSFGSDGGAPINLDGTYTGVNDLAWTVELSDRTDIFVGRDSVADSVSTTGYLPGIETVIATGGNDEIDGGGGYNVADFSQMDAHYLDFDMASGEVSFYHNSQNTNQNWYGFQEVLGTNQNDNIYGTGEEDDELAEVMGSFDFGTNKIEFGAGSNYIEGNGGGDSIYGNGGNDVIHLGGSDDTSSITTAVDGGEGDDLISLGLARDLVSGGGLKDVHSTMDGVNGDFVESDSYYNDAGVDLVYFKLEDGDRPIDITQLSVQISETETVVIDVPDTVTTSTSWEQFVDIANKQINIQFGNIDGTTGQLIADKAYKYLELQYSEYQEFAVSKTKVSGIELYLGEGFSTPTIRDTEANYFYPDEKLHNAPTWANVTFKGMVVGANGFARKNEFVEGSADDGDVFMALTAANIDGDTIHDLDIGQNSLSLTGEVGEAIYFDSDFAGVQKITLEENTMSGDSMAETSYDAVITLDDGGTATDTSDDVSFTLSNINGPTASLLTNGGTYKLAAVVNDVTMTRMYHDDGLAGEKTLPAESMKELTFEWQAVGELVASDDADGNAVNNLLTGSNENNLFRGKGGDDVLNGSGGNDTYQFLGSFGNDKVFDFYGEDTISIGAEFTDVWLERQGRRGDELEITVAGRDTSGTISVGRQFNPNSHYASVENIQFGLTADGGAGETLGLATGNNQGGNIKVLRDGEDAIHAHAERETYIYTNTEEMRGDATVRFLFSEANSESFTYYDSNTEQNETETWSWMSYNFEIEYADGRVDEFEVKADTNADHSQFTGHNGETIGETIAFLSQGGAVQFDTTSLDSTIGITQNAGKTDYSMIGAGDNGADLLLFSLEYIDATTYA